MANTPDPVMTPLYSAEVQCDGSAVTWTYYGNGGAETSTAPTLAAALSAISRLQGATSADARLSIVFGSACVPLLATLSGGR